MKGEPALQEFVKPQREDMLKADAAGMTEVMSSLLPEIDRKAILDTPSVGQNLVDSFREALKYNADGWVDDSMSFIEPWGFDISEIRIPVFLWQGSEDLMVPFSNGKWFAKKLPQDKVVAHLLEGEGHVSIFLGRLDAMMEELLTTRSE